MDSVITGQETGRNWTMINGDCCDVIKSIPNQSIGYSIFSPPFASLYTYSDSPRDMGNCRSYDEFFDHFKFLVEELKRVMKHGRNVSVHCFQIPKLKQADGVVGLRDFRGDIIRLFERIGFVYHSEVCIWKCPVVQMQRTKSIGLLHKQVVKDSAMSRQGLPDYLVTFRSPGDNNEPIAGGFDHFVGDPDMFESNGNLSIDVWQKYASPVWSDIKQTNTLNAVAARSEQDERHICPLQLDVIQRGCQLWSNPDDVVLSPFGGIGSEGVGAMREGRKYIGIELKQSYYGQAIVNLSNAESELDQPSLFDEGGD